jgi:hypothetical protein
VLQLIFQLCWDWQKIQDSLLDMVRFQHQLLEGWQRMVRGKDLLVIQLLETF